MKKILLFLLLIPFLAFSQVHSWDGKGIASNAKLRCLNIFVNIIYDVHPSYNDRFSNSEFWPPITDPALEGINNAAIPTYLLDWMDTVYVPGQLHGSCTRLYGESSFDSLQIIGDFIVVNLRESTVLSFGMFGTNTIQRTAFHYIRTHGFNTLYNHNSIEDYDSNNDNKIDYINILVRNITLQYGGNNPGSGSTGSLNESLIINGVSYLTYKSTFQCVGDGNISVNPTNIVTHEISHNLFGSNAFHTSGGNHRYSDQSVMSFLNIQGGYGLMGAANSGLVGCNGYERWRMHWKHPQATDYISARNSSNTQSITSDISIEDGNKTFILRDFVTYGDVVRIKLPYKDSETSSNQYIWLENHKVGSNGKLDFLQFSNTDVCRPIGAAGIYAYYQIGRDVLEGTSGQVWDSKHRDNLRIIPAEGFYDYEKIDETYNLQCVSYSDHNYTLRRGAANPLCGAQDQEYQLFPNNEDTVLYVTSELAPWRIVKNGENCDNLSFIGDNYDAFTSYTKLNMGTNPSTNNAKTFHSYNYEPPTIIKSNASELNVQTTYLTGLSIEMQPVGQDGDFLVNVRWDDYEIANDARWTGKIELKDTAILTTANTLTLAQNRTVAKDKRDSETGLFAGKTKFTCREGSYFRQDSATTVNVTENSEMFFERGSYYKLSEGATLKIEAGSRVVFDTNAIAQIYGNIEVDSGGVLVVYDTTNLATTAHLIVRPGGKLVVDGGTLTSACAGEMWQGIEIMGNPDKRQIAQYQGFVELTNGATIENAVCAIRTGLHGDNGENAGGIITANHSIFRNNARSIEILPYNNTNSGGVICANLSYFNKCSFVIDTDNNFANNGRSFTEHVKMDGVLAICFYSCNFLNSLPLVPFTNEYRAIYAEDAGFYLAKNCPLNMTFENCVCDETYSTYNIFSGFRTAIEANTTGNQYGIIVDQSKFSNNFVSIKINGNNFVSITRDSFDLSQGAVIRMYDKIGIYLNNCSGYKVEENYIKGVILNRWSNTVGILVNNSGSANNNLYRNTFNTLNYGVKVQGNNGNVNSGLIVACADFTNVNNNIFLANNATMKSTANETINNCASTLCGLNPFNPGILQSNGVAINTVGSNNYSPLQTVQYFTMVRNAMCDTILDLNVLSQLHASAQNIADPYSLVETEFQMGNEVDDVALANNFATNNATNADNVGANDYSPLQTDETTNYAQFHAMKTLLHANTVGANNHSPIQWRTLSDSQIAELQEIAERNTGRASEMAKGVLCFFYGICYNDYVETERAPSLPEDTTTVTTKSAKTDITTPDETNTAQTSSLDVLSKNVDMQNFESLQHTRSGYESFFGKNSWEYAAAFHSTTYCEEYDPYYLQAQTEVHKFSTDRYEIINGKKYYKSEGTYFGTEYIREDTIKGRLYTYFKFYNKEFLMCDMSLEKGDTFTLYIPVWNGMSSEVMLVDTVSYIDSKKQIHLKPFDCYYLSGICLLEEGNEYSSLNVSLQFMEGVGPIYGISPLVESYGDNLPLLLCLHKDDTLNYMTDPILGCYQVYVNVPEYPESFLSIYPNPANSVLNISFAEADEIDGTLMIRDAVGRVCYHNNNLTQNFSSINVANYSKGVYFVTFIDKKNRTITKKFVKM